MDQCSSDLAKDVVKSELNILKKGTHWKKAYFYLWDEARISTSYLNLCSSLCLVNVGEGPALE